MNVRNHIAGDGSGATSQYSAQGSEFGEPYQIQVEMLRSDLPVAEQRKVLENMKRQREELDEAIADFEEQLSWGLQTLERLKGEEDAA